MAKWKNPTATDRQTADPYSGCDPGARTKYIMMHAPTERLDEVIALLQVPNAQLFYRWRVINSA